MTKSIAILLSKAKKMIIIKILNRKSTHQLDMETAWVYIHQWDSREIQFLQPLIIYLLLKVEIKHQGLDYNNWILMKIRISHKPILIKFRNKDTNLFLKIIVILILSREQWVLIQTSKEKIPITWDKTININLQPIHHHYLQQKQPQ